MIIAEYILWISISLIGYTYLFYPLLLITISGLSQIIKDTSFVLNKHERRCSANVLPEVTIVIAAYNEETCIKNRIENLLSLDYPADKLTFLIGSDGSTDKTNEILALFNDPKLEVYCFEENKGKINVLNELMKKVETPITIFSDANTLFEKDALHHLVAHFEIKNVAVVCGELHLVDPFSGDNKDNLYWKYEQVLKFHESRLNALLGANGAIYAIKTKLYSPLPKNTIVDDFCIVMDIVKQGYRAVYAPEARAVEKIAPDLAEESARRVRIGAGNYQAMLRLIWLLSPTQGYRFFSYVSHKILRWFVPHFMILTLITNLVLATQTEFYQYLLTTQIIFYVIAFIGLKNGNRTHVIMKVVQLVTFFVSMNYSLFRGFLKFLNKNLSATWDSTSR